MVQFGDFAERVLRTNLLEKRYLLPWSLQNVAGIAKKTPGDTVWGRSDGVLTGKQGEVKFRRGPSTSLPSTLLRAGRTGRAGYHYI